MNTGNHKILITGATRGIGLALLEKFSGLGNAIVAVAKNQDALDRLKSDHPDIHTIQADLSDQTSLDKLIHEVKTQHPDINILINNAGIQVNFYDKNFGYEPERTPEWKDEIAINFTSPIELTHQLIPVLMANKHPAVINVTSVLAVVPKKSAPVYCATKSGLHIFTKALRYAYEKTDLKIFEILPPLVDTDMTKGRGKGKITPKQLVDEFLVSFKKDRYEVNIGKTKVLRRLQRVFPKMADNILKNN